MRPSIFFTQEEKIANTKNRTVELRQKKIIYGYDILYNPHRDYNKEQRAILEEHLRELM